MTLNKVYSRINWKNYPNASTALNETNLNRMDKAIDDLDNRVIEQDSTKANQTTVNNMVKNWTMDETTGVITVEKQDGSKIMFDLNIEKIPVDFELSPSGILTMTTSDGTQFTANIGSMIPVLTFNESDQIAVSVSGSGVNKTYSFSIKDNSITENKLQPNFLADIKVQSANASLSANNAETSATQAQSYAIGGTGTRENEDTDNAMYYYEQAKQTDIGQISSKVDEINSKLSKQLGNHTVKSDVPENAVFTDTVYDDTEVQKRISDNGYGEVAGGKNLVLNTVYGFIAVDKKVNIDNSSTSYIFYAQAGKTYSFSGDETPTALGVRFAKVSSINPETQEPVSDFNVVADGISTFTTNETGYYMLYVYSTKTSGIKFQIEEGTKVTDYEPCFPSNKMLAEEKADKSETTVNLLNPTLQTTTSNGITCTNNEDGTYTLSGTNSSTSANVTFILNLNYSDFPASKVKLVGCPDLDESGKAILQTFYNETWGTSSLWDTGNGVILENGQKLTKLAILVYPGKNVDGIVFKPMLTNNLDATYDDFVSYTGDTGRLNGDVAKLKNDLDKLSSLPIGSIMQIEKYKDDIETTKQKYGWQYLGTSNIQYNNGSEKLLVMNVYRKNN